MATKLNAKLRKLNPERVRELLAYQDGKLYWRIRRGGRAQAGTEAGTIVTNPRGEPHVSIHIDGTGYSRAGLIWLMFRDRAPGEHETIVHLNNNSLDDRIENLACITYSELGIRRMTRVDNPNCCKGVSWNEAKKAWASYINHHGIRYDLGYHSSFESASMARDIAYSHAIEKFAMKRAPLPFEILGDHPSVHYRQPDQPELSS